MAKKDKDKKPSKKKKAERKNPSPESAGGILGMPVRRTGQELKKLFQNDDVTSTKNRALRKKNEQKKHRIKQGNKIDGPKP